MSAGDYELGSTVFLPFTTRAFATGVPTVLAGTPVIEIYEDASITQITTAETLVVSIDSIVGFNMCSVVATSGNGFGVGQSYTAILSAGTVDSVSVVGEVIGHFTIEMSAAHLRLGAPAGASVSADVADVPTVAEMNARTLVAASYFDPAADAVANVTLTATTTTNTDMRGTDGVDTATMRGTDSALLAASAPTNFGDMSITATTGRVDVAAVAGTAQTANDNGADINAILADTNELQADDVPGLIAALNDVSTAEVLTQVNAALDTAISELGVAAPAATPTLRTGLMLLYMAARNRRDTTATSDEVHNDAGTVIATATLSDDGTTFSKAEYA